MSYPPNPSPGGPPVSGGGPYPFGGQSFGGNPGQPGGTNPPAAQRRPVPVVLAAGILILMGLAGLAYGIAALVEMPAVVDRFRFAAADTGAGRSDVDALVGLIRGGAILSGLLGVGGALVLGTLALGNLRGANGARIATWAICAIGALCGCCGLLVAVVQRAVGLGATGEETSSRELLSALGSAYPTWWLVLGGVLCAGQAVGYLVVAALLALPGANTFYRMPPAPGPSTPPVQPAAPPPPPAW